MATGRPATVIDARALRRLEAMEIQVWRARAPKRLAAEDIPERTFANEPEPAPDRRPESAAASAGSAPRARRIRLEAGSGRWLLVVDDADRARHAPLIEDIRATLGSDDCRFGTWSDSAEAGVAPEDWDAHGIRHALVFDGFADERTVDDAGPAYVRGGALQRLATSGAVRRELWRRLQPLLED